jgi:hypothetical protein
MLFIFICAPFLFLCSTFKGTEHPSEHVIIGAHHDSRGSFLNPRAPGADDDGSGTTMLLQVARIIKANNLSFGRTFVIAAFSGEGNTPNMMQHKQYQLLISKARVM